MAKGNSVKFARKYQAALRKRLLGTSAADSTSVTRLGHEAVASGLDVLALVSLHGEALSTIPHPQPPPGKKDGVVMKRAASFLVEVLTPIAKVPPNEVASTSPPRRRAATPGAREQLKLEIARRKAVQKELTASKRSHVELQQRSARMQAHLRRLSHEILSAQEEERKRISRELHDEIGQTLAAISVTLATLTKRAVLDVTDLTKRIASTQRLLKRSMDTVHRFARELRPPLLDDLGLIPALQSFMREFSNRNGIPVHLRSASIVEQLSDDKRTVIYRVIQEALSNVAKHAKATHVTVRFQKVGDHVRLEVHDDGRSFNVERVFAAKTLKRLGVLGMRERVEMVGGIFKVESAVGSGTTIHVQIPFNTTRVRSRVPRVERKR